jgi:hypothetical protein
MSTQIEFTVLQKKPNNDTALSLLKRLKKDTDPIVKKRNWVIRHIKEFYPKDNRLLGMNERCGSITTIFIRLRHPESDSFMEYDSLLETMLHELTHMEVAPHNKAFFKLLDVLRKEMDMDMRGFREKFKHNYKDLNESFCNCGSGSTTGGSLEHKFKSKRTVLSQAAERRIKSYTTTSGRLGSSFEVNLTPQEIRNRRLKFLEST